ncbi:MAG TPA: cell division protein FtsZ [Thermoanaerobaculaceae bacterium]|nr:cell division protein FtsZ [Thermoanaerobaculaceae bacterium]
MITLDDSKRRTGPAITIADESAPASIKVLGVGGGGSNAVNRMITAGIKGVEFIAVNTDGQALRASKAGLRLQLITPNARGKALGAGCDADAANRAALDKTDELIECLEGADMVFIAAGMGGGTGTGAAPVIGSLARDAGALTVAVVTKPFAFEGARKARIAEKGIEELRKSVDTLITVPNSRLLQMVGPQVSVEEAFQLADEALRHGVQGISDIINETGIINRDFADVETVMRGGGMALMGIGLGGGEHRAIEAAQQAFSSPLLEENSLEGAERVLVNFIGGPDTTISEINDAAEYIAKRCSPDCLFLFGYGQRAELQGKIQVTVVATGFGATAEDRPARQADRVAAKEQPRRERQQEVASPYLPANLPNDYGVNVGNFSEFDTPTYLRRQMD